MVNMVKEEQEKWQKRLNLLKDQCEKKVKGYEENCYRLGCHNSELKARVDMLDP